MLDVPETVHDFFATLSAYMIIMLSPLSSIAEAVIVTVLAVVGLAGELVAKTDGGLSIGCGGTGALTVKDCSAEVAVCPALSFAAA